MTWLYRQRLASVMEGQAPRHRGKLMELKQAQPRLCWGVVVVGRWVVVNSGGSGDVATLVVIEPLLVVVVVHWVGATAVVVVVWVVVEFSKNKS